MKHKYIQVPWGSILSRFYSILIMTYVDVIICGLFFKLTECYKAVNNWTDLLKWKEKEAEMWMNQNGGTPRKYVSFSRNTHPFRLRNFFTHAVINKWSLSCKSSSGLLLWPLCFLCTNCVKLMHHGEVIFIPEIVGWILMNCGKFY